MWGRLSLLAVVAATALVQRLPALPGLAAWVALAAGTALLPALLLALRKTAAIPNWRDGLRGSACVLLCFLLALGWALWRADLRLQDALEPENEDRVSRVTLRVAELVRETPTSRRFVAQVLSAHPAGVPETIEVAWFGSGFAGPYGDREYGDREYGAAEPREGEPRSHSGVNPPASDLPDGFPAIAPGQIWRMALNLRRVSGL